MELCIIRMEFCVAGLVCWLINCMFGLLSGILPSQLVSRKMLTLLLLHGGPAVLAVVSGLGFNLKNLVFHVFQNMSCSKYVMFKTVLVFVVTCLCLCVFMCNMF